MTTPKSLLSVVIPLHNEEPVLPELYARLAKTLSQFDFQSEIIFVNDGSTDLTLMKLLAIRDQDKSVKILNLSRNFGHQLALTAGLDYAQGEAVAMMDGDLQDPPELIAELVAKWRAGYHVISTVRRTRRGETGFKLLTSGLFYRLIRWSSEVEVPADAGDFKLLSRQALDHLKSLRERDRFVRGLVSWIGFRHTYVPYDRDARYAGVTKYSTWRMVRFALDALISFSGNPLRFAVFLGLSVSGFSALMIMYFVGYWFYFHVTGSGGPFAPPPGFSSQIVSIFFLGGVQLICLGIMGEYLARLYYEAKQRPLYIVADAIGFPGNE